jgi:hypothetical protein
VREKQSANLSICEQICALKEKMYLNVVTVVTAEVLVLACGLGFVFDD